MRKSLYWLLISLLVAGNGAYTQCTAQVSSRKDTPVMLLRIYEDNDFLNMRGLGTDEAYTNGTRIDLFYRKTHPSRWWLDRLMPDAGKGSENAYGWGIMQLMFTPRDISQTAYQPDDYSYSGALLVSHTLYSYNPVKRSSIQTEILAGAIGPVAMAAQTQIAIHRLIHYQRPMGWSHQFRNDVLLNVNMTMEKQLAASGRTLELIGGGQAFFGTMLNGVAFYPMLRVGKMEGYFSGFFSQYSSPGGDVRGGGGRVAGNRSRRKKWQAYFILKPEAQFVFTNALLEGGMFTRDPDKGIPGAAAPGSSGAAPGGSVAPAPAPGTTADNAAGSATDSHYGASPGPHPGLRQWVYSMNYGAVFTSGNFGISFIQSSSTAMMKGSYSHEVGNISLYFSW